ncbi:MAG: tetratricopeptide repeat protein, partial [Crocinitomicaceae bacterium]
MNKIIIIGMLVFAFGKCDFLRANAITIEVIDSLNDVCYDVCGSDPDASFQMAQNILKRAEKIDYVGGQMTALCRMGRAVYRQNELDSALHYYDLSQQLFLEKGTDSDSLFLAKTYVYQGLVNKKKGNLDLAASKYQEAYYIAKGCGDEELMSYCLINSSNIYITREEFKEAHLLLNDALSSFSADNPENIALVHLNIGNIYDLEERYRDASDAYRKALFRFRKAKDSLGIAKSLLSIGNICLKKDQPDSARYYYNQTHKIAVKHQFHGVLAKTYQ